MKKSKLKSLVKTARKTAEKDINVSILASLKEITGKFGEGSKKLNKDIEKGSRQLAKKLSKDIKIDKSAFIDTNEESKVDEVIIASDAVVVTKEAKAPKA